MSWGTQDERPWEGQGGLHNLQQVSPSAPTTTAAPPTPSKGLMLGRAVLRRCPVCGSGKLFRHHLRLKPACPRCGFVLDRKEGHFVGAVGFNTIITFGAMLIALAVGVILTAPDIAVVPMLAVGLTIAILGPIVVHPFSWTIWTAVDLMMQPLEPGEAPGLTRDR